MPTCAGKNEKAKVQLAQGRSSQLSQYEWNKVMYESPYSSFLQQHAIPFHQHRHVRNFVEQRGLHARKHNEVEALTSAFISLVNEFESDKAQRKVATTQSMETVEINEKQLEESTQIVN